MPRRSFSSSSGSTGSSAPATVFEAEIVEERPGILIFRVSGTGARARFADEAGGHRFQRVPPNERHGRVHTSTVTVAVMPEPTETEIVVRDSDLRIQATRGSGAGGQARNKVSSAIQVTHIPTGLQVRCETERSQWQNKQTALGLLRARLWQRRDEQRQAALAAERREQVGVGARGDKRRTIAYQRGTVDDHVTGRRWRLKDYLRGDW